MKFLSDILAKAGLTVDGVVTLNNTATGQTPAANDNSTKLATTAWVRGFVTPYSLPIASGVTLGGIKIGSGLNIDGTGIVSVAASGVGAIRALQQITATAGQTVFTVSGGYTPGLIDVFLNGVLLTPTAITSTNGTTFTLADAALVNDLLDIFVYNPIYNGFISTTDQVPEGATNLYFTNARARAAITLTTTGTSGAATYNSSTGVLNIPSYIGGVVSIFGRTGTVVAVSGDYTTALVTEVTNLYYTDARARAAISVTGSGSYDSATGVITVTGGVTSVNTLTGAVTLTTTNIAEGTNLYYTDARVGTYLTTNSYATQTYVGTQIANLVASAPATLDTLNELAVALGNDPSFATTVATSIGTKVPQTRTITINGTTLDLSADRSFTIASGVTSFNTRTGAIVPVSGDYTTALVTESGNLYYTDARARLALSFVAGSGGYNSTTGVITIPTNNNQITNGANYITLVSLSSTATGLTYTNTTGVFSLTAGYSIPTDASQTTWDSAYTNRITSLTTTGTSGAATLSGNVLNIPQYQGGVTSFNTRTGAITLTSSDVTTALTYTPVTNARTLTINGTAYDLTADRTWTVGVSPSARAIQTYTATAAQTTFTVTGGYVVGLVDVFINGVRLTSADFTATNGTTVVLTTGTGVNNIVDVIKYTSAFTASSALRQVTYFTATAGQTSFTVSYTPGLVDVYYNGSKLSSSEYTASNGTTIVLANAAVVNDALEVISYAYSVGAFAGLSTTRTLTINGITFDLSADRTWTLTTSNISEGSNLYYTDTRARAAISLTTTGSSGASTYTSGVINIPTYTLSGLGGQTELNGTGLVRMAGTTVSYDNATYATQSYVTTAVANLVNAAPSTLDTLNELATALGNDANFATTITTSIGTKQPQLNGTGFVKISGTTISYDNSTYLTTASASSTYLPLAGGTLTGSLNGTSAGFSSSVTAVSGVYVQAANNSDLPFINFSNNGGVYNWGRIGGLLQGDGDGSLYFQTKLGGSLGTRLTISSTGAATFSSVLTTGDNVLINNPTASKKGFTYQSPASNWGPQVSGLYFNPVDGVSATPTFTVNLWNGSTGTAGYGGFVDVLTINGAGGAATFSSTLSATTGYFSGNVVIDNTSLNNPKFLQFDANINSGANAVLGDIRWYNKQWDASIKAQIVALTDTDITNGRLSFRTGTDGVNAIERLRISSTGASTFTSTVTAVTNLRVNSTGATGSAYSAVLINSPAVTWNIVNDDNGGDGDLRFYNDSLASDAIRIKRSNNNVGIGFTTVTNKLQVAGEITTHAGTNTQYYAYINYLGTTYNLGPNEATDNIDFKIAGGGTFTTGGKFRFWTQTGNSTPIERMSISTGGNVLIGNGTTAQGPLDIFRSVSGGLGGHIILRNNGAAVGNEEAVMFVDGDLNTMRAAISSTTEGAPYFGDIKFKTGLGTYASLTTRMTITGAGNVRLFVTPALDTKIEWFNTTGSVVQARIWADGNPRLNVQVDGSGGVYLSSGATSWTGSSDETLKDINSTISDAVDKVKTLRAVNFSWKSDSSKKENLGLIAQDVEKVFPQVIDQDKNGIKGVRYTELIPVLVKAIQELKAELDDLKSKN